MAAAKSNSEPKKSELVASRIVEDIIRMGWPVGENLGGEVSLYTHYGVGRDVFRQAVRRIERDGFAVMRRGVNGGLIVTAPAEDGVINALTNYLEIAGIGIDEIIEAQDVLEKLVVQLATERIDEAGIQALSQFRKKIEGVDFSTFQLGTWLLELQVQLARETRNASIVLFLEPLLYYTIEYFDFGKLSEERYLDLNKRGSDFFISVVKAVVARDISNATLRSSELIKFIRHEMSVNVSNSKSNASKRKGDTVLLRHELRQKRENKTAEALAIRISAFIQKNCLTPGSQLGFEPELLERFETSRATFREATNMLESVSRVKIKRGKGGGLVVAEPTPFSTIELTTTYLRYIKFDLKQLLEVRLMLECCAAEYAALRAMPKEKEQLLRLLELGQSASPRQYADVVNELRRQIVHSAHNRVLFMYCEILTGLVYKQFPFDRSWTGWKKMQAATLSSLRAVVEAIVENDSALARRRMYEHRHTIDKDFYLKQKSQARETFK
jgi:DNA-binding FadR family transcriptional regulator